MKMTYAEKLQSLKSLIKECLELCTALENCEETDQQGRELYTTFLLGIVKGAEKRIEQIIEQIKEGK